MVDRTGEPFILATDQLLGAAHREDRLSIMAADVLAQILIPQGRPMTPGNKIQVFLALPECDALFTPADVDRIRIRLQNKLATIQPIEVFAVPKGHAAGVEALNLAMLALQQRATSPVAVVGVDSYIDADVLDVLDQAQRVMSPSTKFGFPPGEGAGALLLASPPMTGSFGGDLARILAAESDFEPQAMMTEEPVCTGEGLARAWRKALRSVSFPAEQIAHTYTDLSGERYRDRELTYTMLRVPYDAFREVEDYTTPANAWGDVGAATIPLLAILATASGRRRCAMGNLALLSASSFGGCRGAVVLKTLPELGGRA